MSKRLQVMLGDAEYRGIERFARRKHLTVSGWVREALQAARRQEPLRDPERKLDIVRAAARHSFPTADVETMLREIERGYVVDGP